MYKFINCASNAGITLSILSQINEKISTVDDIVQMKINKKIYHNMMS